MRYFEIQKSDDDALAMLQDSYTAPCQKFRNIQYATCTITCFELLSVKKFNLLELVGAEPLFNHPLFLRTI